MVRHTVVAFSVSLLVAPSLARANEAPAIPETKRPPLIDAFAEDDLWASAPELSIARPAGGTVTDAKDLAARARLLWDRDALYVYVEVDDESRQADSEAWFDDDGVEIFLDTENTKGRRIGARQGVFFSRWSTGTLRGPALAGVEHAQAPRAGGYRLEVKLPWSTLGGRNGALGLDFVVHDDDDGGPSDGRVAWATGEVPTRLPEHFGTVRLVRANGAPVPVAPPRRAPVLAGRVVFEDDFGASSRGDRADNVVQLPPPKGLGYKTRYPWGHRPTKWIAVDTQPAEDPRRGCWIVPPDADYLVQAGRSIPSYLFASAPVPEGARDYDVEFLQQRNDNDPVAFILGAARTAAEHGGHEISYETQVPGSDKTTTNIYYAGALGKGIVPDQAGMHRWLRHRIEVRGQRVRWLQEDRVIAQGKIPGLRSGGFFGFKHVSDRNTAYDDVKIVVRGPSGRPGLLQQ